MKLPTLFVTSSFFICLTGCAPKVTVCGIDYPIMKAHCAPPSGSDYDLPLDQMDKYSCFSSDDFADLLRGVTGNISICSIVDASNNLVYCNTTKGNFNTTLKAIHKYLCLSDADLAEYERWYLAHKG